MVKTVKNASYRSDGDIVLIVDYEDPSLCWNKKGLSLRIRVSEMRKAMNAHNDMSDPRPLVLVQSELLSANA